MSTRHTAVCLQVSTTPALRVSTFTQDRTLNLVYDGQTESITFKGGSLIVEATAAHLIQRGQQRDPKVRLIQAGDVAARLGEDVGSPAALIWWISWLGNTAPRVDFFYRGVISQLEETPDHEVVATITNALAFVLPPKDQRYSDAMQQARFPGDDSFQYLEQLAARGLPAIQSGEPDY